MEIYYLKWIPGGAAPVGGAAYTDKERAEKHAAHCNSKLKWYHKLSAGNWIVSTLDLREGKKVKK